MRRMIAIIGLVFAFNVTVSAKAYEYVDIDALMHENSHKKLPASTRTHRTPTVTRHTHDRPDRHPRTGMHRRSPEHYVRRHFGRDWRRHRLHHYGRRLHRGHIRPKRGWVLAYVYDHADFYDRFGFHYGDFDRRGFMFEGRWFRYNARYSYRDRLRGRGYFDRYYYVPHHARRYGFCAP